MPKLTVELWSDVACPWCWVGKRNLERAAEEFEHELQIVWRAFELDPAAPKSPPEDVAYVDRLARKYGATRTQAQQMIDQMTERGREHGLEFRFDRVRASNSFDAHRLLHLAAKEGLQAALKERLFVAYMNEGQLIADHTVLVELAAELGLDPDRAQALLSTDTYAEVVRSEQAVARQLGITGVPFYVIAGRLSVGGAQPAHTLLGALRRAWSETATGEESEQGPGCGPEGCVLPVGVG